MIKFKNTSGEYEITDNFEVKGENTMWVNILETFVEFVATEFHPYSGDPFLIMENKLKKMGFEITEVKTTYDPEATY